MIRGKGMKSYRIAAGVRSVRTGVPAWSGVMVGALLAGQSVQAAETAPADNTLTEVVVTGSRIRGTAPVGSKVLSALERVREGYVKPASRSAIPVGGASLGAALKLGVHLAWRAGRASDHDALIGRKLAHIFAGGDLPHAATVDEDYLLDLEREAFLSLLGERKTLERIQHTLKTGKPLRN